MGSIYRDATLNIPSMTEGDFLSTLQQGTGVVDRPRCGKSGLSGVFSTFFINHALETISKLV